MVMGYLLFKVLFKLSTLKSTISQILKFGFLLFRKSKREAKIIPFRRMYNMETPAPRICEKTFKSFLLVPKEKINNNTPKNSKDETLPFN